MYTYIDKELKKDIYLLFKQSERLNKIIFDIQINKPDELIFYTKIPNNTNCYTLSKSITNFFNTRHIYIVSIECKSGDPFKTVYFSFTEKALSLCPEIKLELLITP
jgi:hypothetical protein